jgi:hypothetical protein
MLVENRIRVRQKPVKSRSVKPKKPSVEEQYSRFFAPTPSPLWPRDDVNYSLEQPHFLKVVPTETIYIFPALTQLCPTSNA